MKERILITGANGFVGQHLVQEALVKGFDVHAAVRLSSDLGVLQGLADQKKIKLVELNYESIPALEKILQEGEYAYVVHVAGATKAANMDAYTRINATYTLQLAKACLKVPVKRFVFISSLAALGPLPYADATVIMETATPQPVTSYGKSKALAEKWLADLTDLPLAVIRPTAVYGPGEKDLFILFKSLHSGVDAYIGTQPQRFSFVYVKDLVDAILATCTPYEQPQVFNISDGNVYDRYAIANAYQAWSGKKPFRVHIPLFLVEGAAFILDKVGKITGKTPVLNQEKLNELTAENWNCSIKAAREAINYQPNYDLTRGVKETMDWYVQNKWL